MIINFSLNNRITRCSMVTMNKRNVGNWTKTYNFKFFECLCCKLFLTRNYLNIFMLFLSVLRRINSTSSSMLSRPPSSSFLAVRGLASQLQLINNHSRLVFRAFLFVRLLLTILFFHGPKWIEMLIFGTENNRAPRAMNSGGWKVWKL